MKNSVKNLTAWLKWDKRRNFHHHPPPKLFITHRKFSPTTTTVRPPVFNDDDSEEDRCFGMGSSWQRCKNGNEPLFINIFQDLFFGLVGRRKCFSRGGLRKSGKTSKVIKMKPRFADDNDDFYGRPNSVARWQCFRPFGMWCCFLFIYFLKRKRTSFVFVWRASETRHKLNRSNVKRGKVWCVFGQPTKLKKEEKCLENGRKRKLWPYFLVWSWEKLAWPPSWP